MKYYCENCDRDVDDNGPYETPSGDYICQDCMEKSLSRYESYEPDNTPNLSELEDHCGDA